MRMKRFFILLCIVPFTINAQTKPTPVTSPSFSIQGNLKGIADNSLVFLSGFNGTDTIAKTKVAKGAFTLKGKVENPDAVIINFPVDQKRIILFMGNDNVKINGTAADFSDVTITGSPSNYAYEEFLYHIKPLNDYVNYYRGQVQTAQTQGSHDSAIISLNTAYNIYQQSIDQFLARKPTSPVTALVLAYSYDMEPNKDVFLLQKRYNTLQGDALKSHFAENLQQVIENDKIAAVGTKALDFTQDDTSGHPVSLSQFKGKYVLVDFWASWCGPCRRENPSVVAAYNEFKDKNFTILGVSLDQDKNKWLNAIEKDGLAWTHVSDLQYWGNSAARMYHIQSIPANILVAPDGTIIAKNLRGEDLAATLKNVLK